MVYIGIIGRWVGSGDWSGSKCFFDLGGNEL